MSFCSVVEIIWLLVTVGDWSSGMIPASGAGGRELDSLITPSFSHSQRQLVRYGYDVHTIVVLVLVPKDFMRCSRRSVRV